MLIKNYKGLIVCLNVFLVLIILPFLNVLGNSGSKSNEHVDSLMLNFEQRIEATALLLSNSRYNDQMQDSLCLCLSQIMDSVLNNENSIKYPFAGLTQIGLVKSVDGNLRIFTWFSLKNNNIYRYFGIIQYYSKSQKKNLIFPLVDTKENITNPETANLTAQNWYGALYYEMVEKGSSSGDVYTLIGWDGNDAYSSKKVIDILTFTENGKPKFGKPVFKVGKRKDKRLIFEYNKRATMMISYDKEYGMIVLDHLAPIGDQSADNPVFYGPDLSYDGLKYEDEFWNYQTNIDYKRTKKN